MPGYNLYTIRDEHTGTFIRYVVAEKDVTLGLVGNETVAAARPLAEVVGGPVTVVVKREKKGVREDRLGATGEELARGLLGRLGSNLKSRLDVAILLA